MIRMPTIVVMRTSSHLDVDIDSVRKPWFYASQLPLHSRPVLSAHNLVKIMENTCLAETDLVKASWLIGLPITTYIYSIPSASNKYPDLIGAVAIGDNVQASEYYQLFLTKEAENLINYLLESESRCYVSTKTDRVNRKVEYYLIMLKKPSDGKGWINYTIEAVVKEDDEDEEEEDVSLCHLAGLGYPLPLNCGPLEPLWNRAVDRWLESLERINAEHAKMIAPILTHRATKFIDDNLLPYKHIKMLHL